VFNQTKTDFGGEGLFEKILVPVDGSVHSARALENAIQIAKKFDGRITLIHAYSTQIVDLPEAYAHLESTPKIIEVSMQAGANLLADATAKAKAEKVQVETLLKEGHAVRAILDACKKSKFDLIVIGARGLSTVKEILLGSVSHGITTHARCPVLVVK
jgi:nucleotide-binding universal stress UspA family protein